MSLTRFPYFTFITFSTSRVKIMCTMVNGWVRMETIDPRHCSLYKTKQSGRSSYNAYLFATESLWSSLEAWISLQLFLALVENRVPSICKLILRAVVVSLQWLCVIPLHWCPPSIREVLIFLPRFSDFRKGCWSINTLLDSHTPPEIKHIT